MGKKKNRYIGKWVETGWKTVDLAYTPSNLLMLLDQASIDEHGGYTHQDIVNWCLQYWRKFFEDYEKELDILDKVAVKLASDVDAQWDLYLTNSYSLEQLQNLDFTSINLPQEWFKKWARELRQVIENN